MQNAGFNLHTFLLMGGMPWLLHARAELLTSARNDARALLYRVSTLALRYAPLHGVPAPLHGDRTTGWSARFGKAVGTPPRHEPPKPTS